jgi:hypothetical protein
MRTGIMIGDTPIEILSPRMEHAVLSGPDESIAASSVLDLINVVFALLEELETALGDAEYKRLLRELPDRWSSLS